MFRPNKENDLTGRVGWLYADSLIVLFIIALGSAGLTTLPKPSSGTQMDRTPVAITGLNPKPIDLRFRVPRNVANRPDEAILELKTSMNSPELEQALKRGWKAGLVLTFAGSVNQCRNCGNCTGSSRTSDAVYSAAAKAFPTLFKSNTVAKPLINLGCKNAGWVDMHIYTFTTEAVAP